MEKLLAAIVATTLLSGIALAQSQPQNSQSSVPVSPNQVEKGEATGSKVEPQQPPDASTLEGQRRGAAEIHEQDRQGSGSTTRSGSTVHGSGNQTTSPTDKAKKESE